MEQNRQTARDLVRRSPTVVSGDMPARDAEELATELGIHHLIVVDERRRPRGVLCLCDLWGTGPQVDVSDVMTSPPDVIEAAMPARALVQRVNQLHRGCIPVVSREQVVGVVTRCT